MLIKSIRRSCAKFRLSLSVNLAWYLCGLYSNPPSPFYRNRLRTVETGVSCRVTKPTILYPFKPRCPGTKKTTFRA
ncbi:hypothetical protein BKA59DRAFT_485578 [Fusarium tricinctum]|uniref:Uncharacterized protein n=1 Tax=Fusarium tricinctum TaxID=61284 RepID=A0A8K0W7G0_9HYPO|nr:hypothetical protein BKA59DRAFT_485578 [Fusarium tricinctum]